VDWLSNVDKEDLKLLFLMFAFGAKIPARTRADEERFRGVLCRVLMKAREDIENER
jgi:hypothetical protein